MPSQSDWVEAPEQATLPAGSLSAGTYTMKVTSLVDGNGCTATAAELATYSTTLVILPVPELDIKVNGTSVAFNPNLDFCYDTQMSFSLGAAMASVEYPLATIEWEVYIDGSSTMDATLSGSNSNVGENFNFDFTPATLAEGSYEFKIVEFTDNNACSPTDYTPYVANITINEEPKISFGINGVEADWNFSEEYCYSDAIGVTIYADYGGTAPYDVKYTINNGTQVVETGLNVGDELIASQTYAAGTYNVVIDEIKDANGCKAGSTFLGYCQATITVNAEPEAAIEINEVSVGFNFVDDYCATQIMKFDLVSMVSGGTGNLESIAWSTTKGGSTVNALSGSATDVSFPFDFNFADAVLPSGDYIFTITELTDSEGCS
ncbi:hypothetical protein, partial [Candidatus Venteria ishoeyi]|uniref:hypothetical protein n=1 Tax=Candidatus Venteria ishoeyi TaxID=1899563 RepID=UPI0011B00DAB